MFIFELVTILVLLVFTIIYLLREGARWDDNDTITALLKADAAKKSSPTSVTPRSASEETPLWLRMRDESLQNARARAIERNRSFQRTSVRPSVEISSRSSNPSSNDSSSDMLLWTAGAATVASSVDSSCATSSHSDSSSSCDSGSYDSGSCDCSGGGGF